MVTVQNPAVARIIDIAGRTPWCSTLKMNSIPQPDPDKRWGEIVRSTGTDMVGTGKQTDIFGIKEGTDHTYDEVEPNHWVMRNVD